MSTGEVFVFDDKKYYPGNYKFDWNEGTEFTYKQKDQCQVIIKIIEGIDLMAMDINGKSDPYVKIHVPQQQGGDNKQNCKVFTSTIKKETLSPSWNESFKIDIDSVEDDLIILEVWDKDTIGSDDFLGFLTIDPSILPFGEEVVTTETLSYAEKGKLKISVTAFNFGWVIEGSGKEKYVAYRERLPGLLPYYIEKEESRIKRLDQYSKNRDQGPYVSKSGFPKRLYSKYSVVNGWIKKENSTFENMKENAKTAAIITGAVAGVLFEESSKLNTCNHTHNYFGYDV